VLERASHVQVGRFRQRKSGTKVKLLALRAFLAALAAAFGIVERCATARERRSLKTQVRAHRIQTCEP
jgi:putative heme degradation protein